jgi:transposase-like protein
MSATKNGIGKGKNVGESRPRKGKERLFNDASVRAIRQAYLQGASQFELAARYGANRSTIQAVIQARGAYADGPRTTRDYGWAKGKRIRCRMRFNESEVAAIKAAYREGEGTTRIAYRFGTNSYTLYRVLMNRGAYDDARFGDPVTPRYSIRRENFTGTRKVRVGGQGEGGVFTTSVVVGEPSYLHETPVAAPTQQAPGDAPRLGFLRRVTSLFSKRR